MTLWLLRHALPLVKPGVCYGQLDVAADRTATTACAAALHPLLPKQLNVVASTLQRCDLLAHTLVGLQPNWHVKRDTRLQEMAFGNWEGRPWADIAEAELTAWTDDFAHYRAGGTGESTTQFMARVGNAFDALDPTQDTLWVTHAGVIRAARLLAGGVRHISTARHWPAHAPGYGQWCKLEL